MIPVTCHRTHSGQKLLSKKNAQFLASPFILQNTLSFILYMKSVRNVYSQKSYLNLHLLAGLYENTLQAFHLLEHQIIGYQVQFMYLKDYYWRKFIQLHFSQKKQRELITTFNFYVKIQTIPNQLCFVHYKPTSLTCYCFLISF